MSVLYPGGRPEKCYTGVGSRETPTLLLEMMFDIAKALSHNGYTLRSGGADGSDTAFADGATIAYGGPSRNAKMEIYLPWNGFNGHEELHYLDSYQDTSKYQNYSKAKQLASEIHPVWDKLSRGAKALHARNIYQVLGKDLETPSKFLICYAKPVGNSGAVSGGTNTAVQVALRYKVPVFNLYFEEVQERLIKYSEGQ